MILTGLFRLGRDAELRYTANNTPVCNLSLAFAYGLKGNDGKRPTQWVEATLWGKLAEALAQYLTAGTQVCVTCTDPHIEEYVKRDGSTGYKLAARVSEIELAGSRAERGNSAAAAPAQVQKPQQKPDALPMPELASIDDDVPF